MWVVYVSKSGVLLPDKKEDFSEVGRSVQIHLHILYITYFYV